MPVGNFLQLSVPQNWRQIQGNNTVTFAPEGGYYAERQRRHDFTHGLEIGVIRNESHNLQQGTDELIDSFSRANPRPADAGRLPSREHRRAQRPVDHL